MLSSLALVLALGTAPHPAVPGPAAPDTIRADTEIRQVVLRNAADVRRCYEREGLRRNPELTGLIEIRMTILPTGRVDEVALATSSMRGRGVDEVVRCIAKVARHWRFERGAYSVETVVLPFSLTPAAAEPRVPEWRA
jgi:hypothetical protein